MKNNPHRESAKVRTARTPRGATVRRAVGCAGETSAGAAEVERRRGVGGGRGLRAFADTAGTSIAREESGCDGGRELLGESVRRAIVAALQVWLRLGGDA